MYSVFLEDSEIQWSNWAEESNKEHQKELCCLVTDLIGILVLVTLLNFVEEIIRSP